MDAIRFDTEFPNAREGVFVPPGFASPEDIADLVCFQEKLGYHAVWGTDFLTPTPCYGIPAGEKPDWYEPMIALAYCAARTNRIKLGTGVIMAPFREPVVLAKQAATLDAMSNGRFLLGLGLGMCRDEFEALHPTRTKANRGAMLDECVELLVRLFSEERDVTFEGRYYRVKGVNLYPKPKGGRVPIYVVGRNPSSFERIAKWGLNVTTHANVALENLASLTEALEKHGRTLADIDLAVEGEVRFGPTQAAATAAYERSRHGQFRLRKQPLEAVVSQNWIGTTQAIIDKLGALKDKGFRHFIILHIPCDTLAERKELLQRFAEEVMPALQ
jgi:alkanesulfonate monooxygenase SsuD/methylene tetrahydromethanopterin reductase-like flavin-dependent oxidoreductase (luciferase family)